MAGGAYITESGVAIGYVDVSPGMTPESHLIADPAWIDAMTEKVRELIVSDAGEDEVRLLVLRITEGGFNSGLERGRSTTVDKD